MDDIFVDTEPQYSSPAPSSSSPYDSDAYNTTDARIHFGPLRSPEKKFVHKVASPSTLRAGAVDSLLRRSPRLSSPRPRSPLPATIIVPTENESTLVEGEDRTSEDAGVSRLGTPDNEQILRDEPSSVLASRIIRAHDNPSPPPWAPNLLAMGDASTSASPTPPLALSPHPEVASRDPSGSRSKSSTPTTRSRLAERPTTSAVVTPDLISFDSFSTSKDTFRYVITEPGPTAQPSDTPIIDDLFTRSPSLAPPAVDAALSIPLVTLDSPRGGNNEALGGRFEMTPESIDEQSVLRTLLSDTDESYGGSPKPESPSVPETILLQQIPNPAENQTDASIQLSGYLHYTDDGATLNGESEALPLIDSSDAEIRKKKKREGKRREVSMEVEIVSDSEAGSSQAEDNNKITLTDTGGATQEGGTRKRDRDILKTPTRTDYRELGSLSPTSTNLLTQLLPSPTRGTTPIIDPEAHSSAGAIVAQTPASFESFRPLPLFPQISQPPLPRTPIRSTSPVRFSSPVRANPLHSPGKPRLQPAALDDPNRTPARRIPIDEAVTQGHISPQKAARLTADVGRTPVFNIRPTDSPARRVYITEAPTPSGQKKWQGIRFGSPSRSVSRQRSASIEPLPLVPFSGKASDRVSSSQRPLHLKDASIARPQTIGSSSGTSITTHRLAKLPFPIVASRPQIPSSISEEFEGEREVPEAQMSSPVKPPAPSSSPVKSGLKQTTSKIPRGVKPYARPPLSKPANKEKSKHTMMRTVELPKPGESARVVLKPTEAHTDLGSGSLSNAKPEPLLATPSKSTVSSSLKRKRVPEKVSPVRKTRPVVLLRQVPKVAGPPPKPADVIHVKKAAQPIRRVVERRPEPPPVQPPVLEPDGYMHLDEASGSKSTPEDAIISMTPPTSPILGTNSSSPPPPAAVEVSAEPSGSDTRRRTTRSRKPVNSVTTADVFGGLELRTTQSRRKASAQPVVRSEGAFSGMTAVALKALTSSNTIRNQKYLAAKLETKVIRKEGARPESPAVKIRTISQRMQDEKATQRKERAARRAKRGDDGSSGVEQTETDGQSDVEDSSDWDDQNSSPSVKRHKRGPGEEEDYETPVRPERQVKRPRLGEDGEEASREERRVKWDRGLFTMIYVDEVKVGTRPPPKENLATKGCLALAAKAAPLDNLGNLPEADSALSELVEESIEVKKFVYDNDVEPLPPVIVVKNTRLRSKKAKN